MRVTSTPSLHCKPRLGTSVETSLHKVAGADFDGLRGVMALQDIDKGEEIVAIPATFAVDLGAERGMSDQGLELGLEPPCLRALSPRLRQQTDQLKSCFENLRGRGFLQMSERSSRCREDLSLPDLDVTDLRIV